MISNIAGTPGYTIMLVHTSRLTRGASDSRSFLPNLVDYSSNSVLDDGWNWRSVTPTMSLTALERLRSLTPRSSGLLITTVQSPPHVDMVSAIWPFTSRHLATTSPHLRCETSLLMSIATSGRHLTDCECPTPIVIFVPHWRMRSVCDVVGAVILKSSGSNTGPP